MSVSLRLAALVADPERIDAVPDEELPELLGQVARLWASLLARLLRPETNHSTPPAQPHGSNDRLLKVKELAELMEVNTRWIYRHADKWPFTKRLGPGTLRFSERGFERWLERQ